MAKVYNFAFIFLDEIHHINHFITVAIELSKHHNVSIITYPGKHEYLKNKLTELDGNRVKVEKLKTLAFRAFTDKLKKRPLPRKGFWMKKNKNYILNNFDAIIFTDYIHHKLLKYRGNKEKPKFIKFPHGAPGRGYSYNKEQLDFDFQLLFGTFHYDQYKNLNLLGENPEIIGYPKIDAVKNIGNKKLFNNNNPVVLYNPHFTSSLTSWHEKGLKILKFFYKNADNYNLIFAPHLPLFQEEKGKANPEDIPEKFLNAENIFIDLGSQESVDMTYTKLADIYLGDVSSQVFEFIINPRPCIFMNHKKIDYKADINYRFWQFGQVVSKVKKLKKALKKAPIKFEKKYKEIQEKTMLENFYTENNSTPSERAAKKITNFLDKELPQ